MTVNERSLYVTTAHSTQGAHQVTIGGDEQLSLRVTAPENLGGDGDGWSPEQLYAAAVASCMHQALTLAASELGENTTDSRVSAEVSLEPDGALRYIFSTTVTVELPQVDADKRSGVIAAAVRACPMSEGLQVRAG